VKLLAVSERDQHDSCICCTKTSKSLCLGDVAISTIERHIVTESDLTTSLVCQRFVLMLSKRRTVSS